jgi:hypothetical protein
MAWPIVEIEMAVILGHLLGTKNAATIAVFEQLRRSSAQRDAIMAATNVVLEERDREIISASLNAHKAIESERNAFAHGHFGLSSILPDAFTMDEFGGLRSNAIKYCTDPTNTHNQRNP